MNQTDSGWRKRQIALDKKAENARELGLDYEPHKTVVEQEPVAWMDADGNVSDNNDHKCFPIPLYTTPPQRKPLTDEEIKAVIQSIDPDEQYLPKALRQFARAIEAAHGIGGEA